MRYRNQRKMADFGVVLETDVGAQNVTVRNVTPKGLKLVGLPSFTEETRAALKIRGQCFRGTIKWAQKGHGGFELDRPLSSEVLSLIARRLNASHDKKHRFLM